jgi:ubiquinone/menaquinone biosynthesis C-methylase UbiE
MRRKASTEPPTSILSSPYGALAVHYDTVMAHVDYPGWSRHLRGLWRTVRGRAGKTSKPRRVLELAAGTCRLAEYPLFPDVFTVHTDLSPQMLGTARSRGGKLPVRSACDALALPFRDGSKQIGFDLVLMVYDSLNYLTRPEEVRKAFDETWRVLAPGGVFLVDVTTVTCSKRHFADTLDFQETEAGAVVRASRYDAESRTQLNLFTFFTVGEDGRYDRTEEVHRQRVWPASFLKKTARDAGFKVRACLADFTLNPGTDRDERLHFILQKPL